MTGFSHAAVAALVLRLLNEREARPGPLPAAVYLGIAAKPELAMHVAIALAGVVAEPARRVVANEYGGAAEVSVGPMRDGQPVDLDSVPPGVATATRLVAAALGADWVRAETVYVEYAKTHTRTQVAAMLAYLVDVATFDDATVQRG